MSEVIAEAAGVPTGRIAALSGPNLAAEIARNLPASAVVAADGPRRSRSASPPASPGARFRLYVNEDILGVELCGALKNVVAIAAGAADGLGFGDNGKAGLLTRGLAEMTRLGIAAGANPLTFAGLAGIGDLIATVRLAPVAQPPARARSSRRAARGPRSRRRCRARPRAPTRSDAALALAERYGVEMPIAREVAPRAVRGQERPALPGRPARPRIEGRAGRLRPLGRAP